MAGLPYHAKSMKDGTKLPASIFRYCVKALCFIYHFGTISDNIHPRQPDGNYVFQKNAKNTIGHWKGN